MFSKKSTVTLASLGTLAAVTLGAGAATAATPTGWPGVTSPGDESCDTNDAGRPAIYRSLDTVSSSDGSATTEWVCH